MKKILKITICIMILFIININVYADNSINVENDNESTYVPTNIINGSFDTEPWMDYELDGVKYTSCPHTEVSKTTSKVYFNGVNGGWNTTEKTIWKSNIFEITNGSNNHTYKHNSTIALTDKYVEMNNTSSAMLYQDLTTTGKM